MTKTFNLFKYKTEYFFFYIKKNFIKKKGLPSVKMIIPVLIFEFGYNK